MSRHDEKMTKDQLEAFLEKYGISNREFSAILGVSESAVKTWLDGTRDISIPLSKLFNLFDRRPELMKEF